MNTGIKGNEIVASDTTATAVAVEWRIWQRRRSILIGGVLTTAAAVGILIGFAPGLPPARGESLPALALTETADTTPVRLEFRGHRFVIPRNYFRYPPELDPEAKGGFLLRVLLPDMAPYTAENAKEFDAPGFGRKLSILVHNEPEIRPLAELLRFRLKGIGLDEPLRTTYGLGHAMTSLGTRIYHHYAAIDGSSVKTLILCHPAKSDVEADCDHLFKWDQLDIQLNYAIRYLADWQKLQNQIVCLFVSLSEHRENWTIHDPYITADCRSW